MSVHKWKQNIIQFQDDSPAVKLENKNYDFATILFWNQSFIKIWVEY